MAGDLTIGAVEVGYPTEAGRVDEAFLPEERTLLAVAADRLGSWIEQRDVHEQLEQRDLRWRSLYDRATIGIVLFDSSHRVIDCNPAAARALGYTREEFGSLSAADLVHPDDQAVLSLGDAVTDGLGHGPTHRLERRYRTRCGDYLTVLRSITRLEGLDDEVSHVVMFTDISDRKRSEAQVLALLRQKEALLDEVHHRIRNNMNTLMGLLALQAQGVAHEDAARALLDARTRVGSMAKLYDRLYQTGNTAAMPLDLYLVPLVHEVVSLFPAGATTAVHTDVASCELDSKTLAAVGTMVNELLTNAMKYAFADGRSGTLSVAASLTDGALRVTVADDGVGMPTGDPGERREGLGMKLVSLLAEQLEGEVRVDSASGTCVTLDLHLPR